MHHRVFCGLRSSKRGVVSREGSFSRMTRRVGSSVGHGALKLHVDTRASDNFLPARNRPRGRGPVPLSRRGPESASSEVQGAGPRLTLPRHGCESALIASPARPARRAFTRSPCQARVDPAHARAGPTHGPRGSLGALRFSDSETDEEWVDGAATGPASGGEGNGKCRGPGGTRRRRHAPTRRSGRGRQRGAGEGGWHRGLSAQDVTGSSACILREPHSRSLRRPERPFA